MNKVDKVWIDIEDKFHYLDSIKRKGSFTITSDEIKSFMEPRLVTKFDSSEDLPLIFKENNLSILPINRGSYILSDIKTFLPIQIITSKPELVTVNGNLTTATVGSISSETQAINFALSIGLLSEFVEEQQLFPTLDGRQSSGAFNFAIERYSGGFLSVSVDKAQVEIDKCLEGTNNIILIEAKKDRIMPDFMIRQLYYPYRMLQTKSYKPIIPLFFSYNNGILDLRQYLFEDNINYNSISLIKNKRYYLHDGSFNFNKVSIVEHILKTSIVDEPTDIPFPQADTFDRVLSICEKLSQGEFCPIEMTYAIGVTTTRQVLYYGDAACYLGLAQSRKIGRNTYYSLSKLGKSILKELPYKRLFSYMLLILSHGIFREVFLMWDKTGNIPDKTIICNLMKTNSTIQALDDTVYERRSSTVRSWIKWIVNNLN